MVSKYEKERMLREAEEKKRRESRKTTKPLVSSLEEVGKQEARASRLAELAGLEKPTPEMRRQASEELERAPSQVFVKQVQTTKAALEAQTEREARESAERKAIVTGAPDYTKAQRTRAAGISALQQLGAKAGAIVGVEMAAPSPYEVEARGGALALAGGVLGFVGTVNLPLLGRPFSVFSQEGATLQQMQNQAADYKKMSIQIIKGYRATGNVDQALSDIVFAEARLQDSFNQAEASLRESPVDIGNGVDLASQIASDLEYVQKKRNALERAQLGDYTAIDSAYNSILAEESLQSQQSL